MRLRNLPVFRGHALAGLVFLVALLFGPATPARASDQELKLRAQLIWGTDEAKPKDAAYKDLEPDLRQKLGRIFKWKNYWQISEQRCGFKPGETKKLKMSAKCDLEVRHLDEATIEIKLFGEGKLTRTVRQSIRVLERGELTVLAGDDKDKHDDAWFVVITSTK
ncbi:MAG: hypothetical protein IPM17_13205 [Verrucomicrobia bacterium]|jgi:hypothetical protein|nr:hypothetical protein [Verrucomicrobiota bacterium]